MRAKETFAGQALDRGRFSMEPIRRRDWSPHARLFGRGFALVVMKPILAILSWFGLWPRLLARGMRAMHAEFGPYRPRGRDVLVCSYFKSGTNWTMQMAVQVAHRGRVEFEHIHDLVPWPDLPTKQKFAVDVANDRIYAECPSGLKVIKTHLTLRQLPWSEEAKYLCVVRDPKDVFVSSYHFVRAVMLGPLMPTSEQWLELYLSPDTPLGSWAEHAAGFWGIRDEPNVLFLTFEAMKLDPRVAVGLISDLMGVDLTDAEQRAVLEQSDFAYMKSISRKFDPIGIGPPWADARGSMVRRGAAGGASEMLSEAQRRRIDDFWSAELVRLGSDFPYDQLYRS